ncbi:MAG: amidophosphoribosyltransferase [Rhodobacteraceae bacterium]|nr:amidophosphoribosyltransferase [Paracoccaceae bacterium]
MQATLQTLVTVIYPPRCLGCGTLVGSDFGLCPACWRDTPFIGGLVCDSCGMPLPGEGDGCRIECDDCLALPRPWDQGRAALLYKDQGRRLVMALKHGDRTDIARPAASWMARAARPIISPDMLVAPVPLHWLRLAKRRYNQAALLSRALAGDLGLDHCPDLFQRIRRTVSLDNRSAADRHEILGQAIRVHPRRAQRIAGRSLLLVDDVMTSGATLAATSRAAHAAGAARVCVITLARVAKEA